MAYDILSFGIGILVGFVFSAAFPAIPKYLRNALSKGGKKNEQAKIQPTAEY